MPPKDAPVEKTELEALTEAATVAATRHQAALNQRRELEAQFSKQAELCEELRKVADKAFADVHDALNALQVQGR